MKKLKLEQLDRLDIESYKSISKQPIVLVLDNIRSAMNVGSFFRTADSFALDHIYLVGISASPPHPEINKTAIGATLSVDWSYDKEVLEVVKRLKKDNYLLIGIEQTDHSISLDTYTYDLEQKVALVFGNEVDGLSPSILPELDCAIEVPQYGTKHSLNVAVCGGIVIWDFIKKRIGA